MTLVRPQILALVALLAGCGSETGIIVAVSGGSYSELQFEIGTRVGDRYLRDAAASGQRADVGGRNLRGNPYELLLREQDSSGDPLELLVLALAYSRSSGETRLAGYAVTNPPQRFIRGEIVRRPISVGGLSSTRTINTVDGRCFRARVGEHHFAIVVSGDADCDGSTADGPEPDCNDGDPAIYPGAPEICDGKDNNCDQQFADPTQVCYQLTAEAGPCLQGSRGCADAQGGGLAEQCSTGGAPVPGVYCRAYQECGSVDPLTCVAHVGRRILSCTLDLKEGTTVCPGAELIVDAGPDAGDCRWAVFDDGGFGVKLAAKEGEPAPVVEACEAKMQISGVGGAEGGSVVLEFTGKPAAVWEAKITTNKVTACGETPLRCQ